LVGLAAEVIVSTSNNRRLRALYTRESPIKSSLLDQPRPFGEMKKINRMIRYNSAEICAREEARPVGVKLGGSDQIRGCISLAKIGRHSLLAITQRYTQLLYGAS